MSKGMPPNVPDERASLCCWTAEDSQGALGEDRLVQDQAADEVVQVRWPILQ